MEPDFELSYVLLLIAAVAVVVFFVAWSRRSKPTGPPPDRPSRQGDREDDAREPP